MNVQAARLALGTKLHSVYVTYLTCLCTGYQDRCFHQRQMSDWRDYLFNSAYISLTRVNMLLIFQYGCWTN